MTGARSGASGGAKRTATTHQAYRRTPLTSIASTCTLFLVGTTGRKHVRGASLGSCCRHHRAGACEVVREWAFFEYLAALSNLQVDEALSGTKRVPR